MTGSVDILLVEDNPADARLVVEALVDLNYLAATCLNVVVDGEEALAYLRQQGKHVNAARPDLILLDLNLPKMDGREVLSQIKEDPQLRAIPVVVLSTSTSERDIAECYQKQANCYVSKPSDLEEFAKSIKMFHSFWVERAKLDRAREAALAH